MAESSAATAQAIGSSRKTAGCEKVRLHDLPSALKRRRIVLVSVCLLVLLVGIIVAATAPNEPVCFPLPDIQNASSVCHGFASMRGGSTCNVHCEQGFSATGVLRCGDSGNSTGQLVEIPSCVTAA